MTAGSHRVETASSVTIFLRIKRCDYWPKWNRKRNSCQANELSNFFKMFRRQPVEKNLKIEVYLVVFDLAWHTNRPSKGNHCFERADLAAFVIASGGNYKVLPAKISDPMAKQLQFHPVLDCARITVAAPIKMTQTFELPTGESFKGKNVTWAYHAATLVNVEDQWHVVDLTLSEKLIPLKEWLSKVVKARYTPTMLDADSFNETYLFNQMASRDRPKHLSGYRITPFFTDDSPLPPPGGWVRYQLESAASAMSEDADSMMSMLLEQGFEVREKDLAAIKTRLESVTARAWWTRG